MDTLDISVVICAYSAERWDNLVAAVESIAQQTVVPRDLVVVIDHNPQLFERARVAFSQARVLENTAPQGLSGARNIGIAATHGAIVAFLDDDAVALSDWIEQIRRGYDHPSVVGVGGTITPQWESGRPAWFPKEFDWVVGCSYRGLPEASAPVRNLIGANMSFRRSVFTSVGGFRSGVGQVGASMLRCDDTEFCIRVRQQLPNSTIRYLPAAQVLHQVPAARASWHYFRTRCYTEGIAKAQIARLSGAADGLSSERSYALRTLPLGVLRNLVATITQSNAGHALQAATIVAGLGTTTLGYVVGWCMQFRAPRADMGAATASTDINAL